MFISMLKSLEACVSDTKSLPFIRIYSWWVLLHNWCTLRFSDHRGLRPQDIKITNNTLDAVLSRSKTTGDDKNVTSCPVHVENCCFFLNPSWITIGWDILRSIAPFVRDYLLPTPTDNYMSCKQQVMRYELGYALQHRVLSVATCGAGRLFKYPITQHWTLHLGGCFMPSATAVLNYEKSHRDFLGRWSAKGSDVYARVARVRVANLQRAVVSSLQSSSPDPIAESEITHELFNHLEN